MSISSLPGTMGKIKCILFKNASNMVTKPEKILIKRSLYHREDAFNSIPHQSTGDSNLRPIKVSCLLIRRVEDNHLSTYLWRRHDGLMIPLDHVTLQLPDQPIPATGTE